jgi:hypothetical protein
VCLSKKVGAKQCFPETHAGLNKHDGFVALLVDRDINGHTKPQGGLVTQEPGDFAQSSTPTLGLIQIFVRTTAFWTALSSQTLDLTM